MANRIFHTQQAAQPNQVIVAFSFAPNGVSQPVVAQILGRGVATVVRDGAGAWTVTLEDQFLALMSAEVQIAMVTATDITPQIGAVDVVTAKTIELRALVAAVETDIAANAANRIYVTLHLRNTTVT